MAPIVENRKGEHRHRLQTLMKEGYARIRIDGVVRAIEDVQRLAKHKKHTIEVVVDRLIIKAATSFRKRLTDSVETTLKLGRGRLIVHILEGTEILWFKLLDFYNTLSALCQRRQHIGCSYRTRLSRFLPF